jgi:hypothetical protein
MRKPAKIILGVVLGLSALCLVVVLTFYLTNQSLPTHSKDPAQFTDEDQNLFYEANHLRHVLGGQVWPGWEQAKYVPFVAYDEAYAFLIGMADPPAGWTLPGKLEKSGSTWEQVAGSNANPAGYYRQPVTNAARAIGAFTVRIGDTWAASLPTSEWFEIEFYNGMRQQLPPLVKDIFPYVLSRSILLGGSDRYITGQLHEAFHAFQATEVPNRLLEAEATVHLEASYPWDDQISEQAWQIETDLLKKALKSTSAEELKSYTRQFLAQRQERREATSLSPAFIDFERQREWLEGTAKYVELASGHLAATTPGYQPLESAGSSLYGGFERFYQLQLNQVGTQKSETRFYYTGMAQAILLDRLLPGWKDRALNNAFLEDLLAEAVR